MREVQNDNAGVVATWAVGDYREIGRQAEGRQCGQGKRPAGRVHTVSEQARVAELSTVRVSALGLPCSA